MAASGTPERFRTSGSLDFKKKFDALQLLSKCVKVVSMATYQRVTERVARAHQLLDLLEEQTKNSIRELRNIEEQHTHSLGLHRSDFDRLYYQAMSSINPRPHSSHARLSTPKSFLASRKPGSARQSVRPQALPLVTSLPQTPGQEGLPGRCTRQVPEVKERRPRTRQTLASQHFRPQSARPLHWPSEEVFLSTLPF